MKYLSVLLVVCIIIMICITGGVLIEKYFRTSNKPTAAEHKHSKSRIIKVDQAIVSGDLISIIRVDSIEFLVSNKGGVVELK